ncbi:MAG: dUTP diphosphatase [Rickettsiaceae bacterium]|nr:dUTP diphosphatase [Rickettsiaceae bacterium]
MTINVHIKRLDNLAGLELPRYATSGSAGVDLVAAIDDPVVIKPGNVSIIPTGIAIALPHMYEAQIRPRSGIAAKNGVTVLNTPGTIDSDYRGEIKALMINHSANDFVIERGMRIAQMIIAKYEQPNFTEVDSLESTERGASGFGSTGL